MTDAIKVELDDFNYGTTVEVGDAQSLLRTPLGDEGGKKANKGNCNNRNSGNESLSSEFQRRPIAKPKKDSQVDDTQKGVREPDAIERRKNTTIFVVAMIGIFLDVIELQVYEHLDDMMFVEHIIRICLSLSTLVLLLLLIDLYHTLFVRLNSHPVTQVGKEKGAGQRRVIAVEFASKRSYLVLFYRSGLLWRMLVELAICSVHLPPFIRSSMDNHSIVGLFMFVRCYLFVRVMRDRSLLYKERDKITQHKFYERTGGPEFDWFFSLKSDFHERPGLLCTLLAVVAPLVMAYCLYVSEHHTSPEVFTYYNCIFFTILSMTTASADNTLITVAGKASSLVSVIIGILLFSLVVGVLVTKLSLSHHQQFAISYRIFIFCWIIPSFLVFLLFSSCFPLVPLVFLFFPSRFPVHCETEYANSRKVLVDWKSEQGQNKQTSEALRDKVPTAVLEVQESIWEQQRG